MKRKEILNALQLIYSAWPVHFRKADSGEVERTIELWDQFLSDVDGADAMHAVEHMVLTSPHPPTIADIRRIVAKSGEL